MVAVQSKSWEMRMLDRLSVIREMNIYYYLMFVSTQFLLLNSSYYIRCIYYSQSFSVFFLLYIKTQT